MLIPVRFRSPRTPSPSRHRSGRRTTRLILETLEDRLTPTVTFNPATGALFLQADSPSTNDTVVIRAAGTAGDGSTGVTVYSDLTGGKAVTYGDASHPVTQISLDLKGGNDAVCASDLTAVDLFIGEGDGNDIILAGKTAGAGVIAGNGQDKIVLRDASRDGLSVGNAPFSPYARYVGLGYQYSFDAAGGSFTNTSQWSPGAGNPHDNFVQLLGDSVGQYPHMVDVNGSGNNTIIEGNSNYGGAFVEGNGNNSITLGNGGGGGWVQVTGNGNNAITLGGTYGQAVVYGDANNSGDNSIVLGGANNYAEVDGGGNNHIKAGDGAGQSAFIWGTGNNTVEFGNGDGDSVGILAYRGDGQGHAFNGTGSNHVWVGNGAGDSVGIHNSDGNNTVVLGDGASDIADVGYNYYFGLPSQGNNSVRMGNGDHDQALLGGTGNNAAVLGDGAGDSVALDASTFNPADKTYGNSDGNNTITLGNGAGDSVSLDNSDGSNVITLGNGAGDNVQVYAVHDAAFFGAPHVPFTGNSTVRLGDGAGDDVTLSLDLGNNRVSLGNGSHDTVSVDGTGGTGSNYVRVGDGAGDAVTVLGDGTLAVMVGTGGGAAIDVEGAGTHVIYAPKNAGATITDVGGSGSIDAAAGAPVAVDGVTVTAPGWVDGLHVRFFA